MLQTKLSHLSGQVNVEILMSAKERFPMYGNGVTRARLITRHDLENRKWRGLFCLTKHSNMKVFARRNLRK